MQKPDIGHSQSCDRRSTRVDVAVRMHGCIPLHLMFMLAYLQTRVLMARLRLTRQGLTPVDHAKNNIADVRAMSKAARDRRPRGAHPQPMQSSASTSAPTRYASNVQYRRV